MWAEPPARAGVEAESERGWEAGVGPLPPPPPPPARLGWRQLEDCDLRRGASAMTAELQQDDAAGAADRLGSVGPATAMGAEGPGSAPRKGKGCGAGVGAARVAGGQAGLRVCGRPAGGGCGGHSGRALARVRTAAREEAEVCKAWVAD